MQVRCLLLVALLAATVLGMSAPAPSNPYSSQYESLSYPSSYEFSDPPVHLLGSFQGSYTSSSSYGIFGTYICVDGNRLQGMYDQVGIFNGEISSDGTSAEGNFYSAGNDNCNTGTFSISLTEDGFDGTYRCDGSNTDFQWTEVLLSNFRPSDDLCCLIDLDDDDNVSGRWFDQYYNPWDICADGGALEASYLQSDPDYSYPKVEGYVEATEFERGHVAAGTWYEELNGGAILFFKRNDGTLQYFWWTGLFMMQGETVIDPSQYQDEEKHGWETLTGPEFQSSIEDCGRFMIVKEYTLINLRDDDDDYYYFVDSDYFNSQFDFQYLYYAPSNSAVVSTVSILVSTIVVLVLFF